MKPSGRVVHMFYLSLASGYTYRVLRRVFVRRLAVMAGPPKKPRRRFTVDAIKRSHRENDEIKAIESAILAGAPDPGTNPLTLPAAAAAPKGSTETLVNYAAARTFDELPMSTYTKESLRLSKYITLTAIQRAALPHALAGRDILGAAKTGSGKTLAFLVPVSLQSALAVMPAYHHVLFLIPCQPDAVPQNACPCGHCIGGATATHSSNPFRPLHSHFCCHMKHSMPCFLLHKCAPSML